MFWTGGGGAGRYINSPMPVVELNHDGSDWFTVVWYPDKSFSNPPHLKYMWVTASCCMLPATFYDWIPSILEHHLFKWKLNFMFYDRFTLHCPMLQKHHTFMPPCCRSITHSCHHAAEASRSCHHAAEASRPFSHAAEASHALTNFQRPMLKSVREKHFFWKHPCCWRNKRFHLVLKNMKWYFGQRFCGKTWWHWSTK